MKIARAVLSVCLLASPIIRADVVPPKQSPEEIAEFNRHVASSRVTELISDITMLDTVTVPDGPDKEKRIAAAKAEIQTAIRTVIRQLTAEQSKLLKQLIADQEAALSRQLDAATNQADKDKIQEQLKPYKTLRERFLQASIETDSDTAAAQSNALDLARAPMIFAGLALTLAFVSAGLIYARKNV